MNADLPHDFAFLLQAANYGGGDGQFSPAAREAVEAVAKRLLAVAELDLKRAKLQVASLSADEPPAA